MQTNYAGYPVYKGLQMPLEFMGIRGRFIGIAAATFGAAFLGFIAGYVLFGLGIVAYQAERKRNQTLSSSV